MFAFFGCDLQPPLCSYIYNDYILLVQSLQLAGQRCSPSKEAINEDYLLITIDVNKCEQMFRRRFAQQMAYYAFGVFTVSFLVLSWRKSSHRIYVRNLYTF
jgi:hypothetical protein